MKQLPLQFEDRPAAKPDIQIRFLLGPAGSGKTWQCLDEIRRELITSAVGAPLIFLAPKQATFQLERQLLDGPQLSGYSRLHILSFERLARFVFRQLKRAEPRLLSEQGRVMVLRAILNETQKDLTIFQNCARRSGFAQELSDQIREFQNYGLSPEKIRELATRISGYRVRQKLLDLAFLHERYRLWLDHENLEDADALLEKAADLLESTHEKAFQVQAVWFDGFAQLTPQERRFLVSILPCTKRATLAFCLAENSSADSEFSSWYLVSETARKCASAIENRFGQASVTREFLQPSLTRFAAAADLAHLEANWAAPKPRAENSSIHLIECGDPQQEASFCAREIIRHVRQGGRYRDAAILLRNFENDYSHVFRRVFNKYQIPFFLDHRESIAHHPLAELTRGAIRTLAFNWRLQDWFATLKSGLVLSQNHELDQLENQALARGWEGSVWESGFRISADPGLEESSNQLRKQLVPPFFHLRIALGEKPSGLTLAQAIQKLWERLRVQSQIEDWARDTGDARHETVWTQMQSWLENLALAFRDQTHSLADWLPILEAGLSGLTVGIIPPVLDQVLIGAADRSRNPDLKLLFVGGFNENIFPARPAHDSLLSESDCDALRETGSELAEIPALHFAQEQFYGYIACTRPREKLIITYAKTGLDGKALNPSRFVAHLQRLFPNLKPQTWNGLINGQPIEHFSEIYSSEDLHLLLQHQKSSEENPLTRRYDQLAGLSAPPQDEKLDPPVAALLYGKQLNVSVSSLEQYAMCPFRFFLNKGLGLQERERYELDVREQGSFQHEVLSRFHEEVRKRGKQWRDLSADEASDLIGEIADVLTPQFKDGLLEVSGKNRFAAGHYKSALQDFIRVIIDWFGTNDFNPAQTEMAFGLQSDIPGWRLLLKDNHELVLHGRMDRIDLLIDGKEALALVMDYKSGSKNPDKTLLHHGIQQQLPAYLLALSSIGEIAVKLGVEKVIPAGCFFVPLRGKYESEKNRAAVLAQKRTASRMVAQHLGLFNFEHIRHLDKNYLQEKSEQFRYRLNKDRPHGSSYNALPGESFDFLLKQTRDLLVRFGDEIYSGNIRIFPHKKGAEVACEKCQYQAICRFDPWEQPYNTLAKPANGKASSRRS